MRLTQSTCIYQHSGYAVLMAPHDWDEHAASWDDNPETSAYADRAFASLQRRLEARGESLAGRRVLDFGCGTGLLTERLLPHVADVVAVDASPAMLSVLEAKRARPGFERVTVVGDVLTRALLRDDPRLSGGFDLVVASSVLAFVPDHPAMVGTLAAALRPGGLLMHWDWELQPSQEPPFGLTRAAIAEALRAAELDDIEVGPAFTMSVTFGGPSEADEGGEPPAPVEVTPLMASGARGAAPPTGN